METLFDLSPLGSASKLDAPALLLVGRTLGYRHDVEHAAAFLGAVAAFFGHLAAVQWPALALAVAFHLARHACRVCAWRNILRASYPRRRIRFRSAFGAYVAGVGVNSVAPARGGELLKVYLGRQSIPGSSYPTVASTLVVDTIFDFLVASALFLWALERGLLPGVPVLLRLPALDWALALEHPRLAAVLGSVVLAAAILLAAWASTHVTAFREKVAQGFAVLGDHRAYLRHVVTWQAASWVARLVAIYWFLRAFNIDPALATVLTVVVVQGLATMLPFTPGGAGTQQALLAFALAGTAATSAVLAFSVGMQVVTVVVNVLLGLAAIAFMTGTLRWRSRIVEARDALASARPAAVRSRSSPPG